MIKLLLQCKNYAWGSRGSKSLVSELFSKNREQDIEEDEFYAELWAGVHPNGDAEVILPCGNCKLSEYLKSKNSKELSYLLKILSVDGILSIQMHPDIENAKVLHEARPDIYPDSNHKPEMVIALTEFHMLCGFQSPSDLLHMLEALPSLKSMLGEHISDNAEYNVIFKNCLKSIFELSKEDLLRKICLIKEEFDQVSDSYSDTFRLHQKLFYNLMLKYPDDPGCLVVLLLNYNVLTPGECAFVCAVMPHAYIKGECIEIMSNSDNVVRLGLTPKVKDIPTAFKLLDTSTILHEGYYVTPVVDSYEECKITTYVSGAEEFCLTRFQGSSNSFTKRISVPKNSIMLNIKGRVLVHFEISSNLENKQWVFLKGSAVLVEEDIVLTILEYECMDLVLASPRNNYQNS